MSVPDTPLIQFLHALIDTPPVGGLVVGLVAAGSLLAYGLAIRWIAGGREADEETAYAYPTPALVEASSDGQEPGS